MFVCRHAYFICVCLSWTLLLLVGMVRAVISVVEVLVSTIAIHELLIIVMNRFKTSALCSPYVWVMKDCQHETVISVNIAHVSTAMQLEDASSCTDFVF